MLFLTMNTIATAYEFLNETGNITKTDEQIWIIDFVKNSKKKNMYFKYNSSMILLYLVKNLLVKFLFVVYHSSNIIKIKSTVFLPIWFEYAFCHHFLPFTLLHLMKIWHPIYVQLNTKKYKLNKKKYARRHFNLTCCAMNANGWISTEFY